LRHLQHATTKTILVGPFIDVTDGITPLTAITPVFEISKNDAAFVARNSATAVSHDAEGFYFVELNTIDTATTGNMTIKAIDTATHLPFFVDYEVLADEAYRGKYDVGHTVDTVTNSHTPTQVQFQCDTITETTAGHYAGRRIKWTLGNLTGQTTLILGYSNVGGIGQFQVDRLTEPPANNDEFIFLS